jgi:hypothetical protein
LKLQGAPGYLLEVKEILEVVYSDQEVQDPVEMLEGILVEAG